MAETFPYRPPLAVGSIGLRSSGFWGMVFLVLSEASLFAYLLFSFYYFSIQPHAGPWPPEGPPILAYAIGQTIAIAISSGTIWWASRNAALGRNSGVLIGLGASLALGVIFIALQFIDWYQEPISLASDPYASLYYLLTGAHLAHLFAGVVMIAAVLVWSFLGYFGPIRHAPVTITAFYWYFVAVVWVAVFFTIYITPFLS